MVTKPARSDAAEGAGRTPAGLITWYHDHEVVAGGRYRIRNVAPLRWELTFRDRRVSEHRRLSTARVAAELHHRRVLRRVRLIGWGTLAAGGLAAAFVLAGLGGPAGILGTVGAVWLVLIAAPRIVAAFTGNLLDPYRRRDPWESPDWWNRNP